MAGKRKQEECRLTNEQQEKLLKKGSTIMKAIYGMYQVLPNPRKKVAKGYIIYKTKY